MHLQSHTKTAILINIIWLWTSPSANIVGPQDKWNSVQACVSQTSSVCVCMCRCYSCQHAYLTEPVCFHHPTFSDVTSIRGRKEIRSLLVKSVFPLICVYVYLCRVSSVRLCAHVNMCRSDLPPLCPSIHLSACCSVSLFVWLLGWQLSPQWCWVGFPLGPRCFGGVQDSVCCFGAWSEMIHCLCAWRFNRLAMPRPACRSCCGCLCLCGL